MTWLFSSLAGYKPDWLRSDILAGLTVWAVLVPEALAYATIAGVLDLEAVPAVDLTAAKMLDELKASLAATGQTIVYTRNVGQVRDVLRADGAGDAIVYPTIAAAVEASRGSQPDSPGRP